MLLVLMMPKDANSSEIRVFAASGDLCADLSFSDPHPVTQHHLPMDRIKTILKTVTF